MNPANKTFLDANERFFTTLRDAGYMLGLDGNTRSAFARIICEEFQPGYATDMWCPPCVADMVLLLYRYYGEWKEKNPPVPMVDELHAKKSQLLIDLLTAEPVQLAAPVSTAEEDFCTTPVFEPNVQEAAKPVIKKANFPKHNNRRR